MGYNIDKFKQEYLCKWVSETDEILRVLALRYEYRCEIYDRRICRYELLFDDRGFVMFGNNETRGYSIKNARRERELVQGFLLNNNLLWEDYKDIKKNVDRLTWNGLRLEYENIPKGIMDKLEELENHVAIAKHHTRDKGGEYGIIYRQMGTVSRSGRVD